MGIPRMLKRGGEVAAAVVLSQVEATIAGEYCHGHANENNLRYQAGFYCPVFCCGQFHRTYCCAERKLKFTPVRHDGSPDMSDWHSTLWLLLGITMGTLFVICLAVTLVVCFCCDPSRKKDRSRNKHYEPRFLRQASTRSSTKDPLILDNCHCGHARRNGHGYKERRLKAMAAKDMLKETVVNFAPQDSVDSDIEPTIL